MVYAEEKARHRLREEFESWQLMRRSGFADLIARFMELRELPEGLVLAAEPLLPFGKEARHNYMLPVAQRSPLPRTPSRTKRCRRRLPPA